LAVLSLLPDEQVRVNGPGCTVCDLLADFDHARTFALETASATLTAAQRGHLDLIDAAIGTMQKADLECGNDDVVRRPIWQKLRDLATHALQEFGWTGAKVAPFSEESPGVWGRPPGDT
jgi:hypothetical protein